MLILYFLLGYRQAVRHWILIPVFAGSNSAKETCERKTTMVIIKTIISTLDVIFMLILFVSGRESKDKGTAIALCVLVMLLLLNMFLMWR